MGTSTSYGSKKQVVLAARVPSRMMSAAGRAALSVGRRPLLPRLASYRLRSTNSDGCPFGALGLPPLSPREDVVRAFREEAKKTHPDLNPAGDAVEQFKQLGRSYELALSQLAIATEEQRREQAAAAAAAQAEEERAARAQKRESNPKPQSVKHGHKQRSQDQPHNRQSQPPRSTGQRPPSSKARDEAIAPLMAILAEQQKRTSARKPTKRQERSRRARQTQPPKQQQPRSPNLPMAKKSSEDAWLEQVSIMEGQARAHLDEARERMWKLHKLQETPVGQFMRGLSLPGGGTSLMEELEAQIDADIEKHAKVIQKAALWRHGHKSSCGPA